MRKLKKVKRHDTCSQANNETRHTWETNQGEPKNYKGLQRTTKDYTGNRKKQNTNLKST